MSSDRARRLVTVLLSAAPESNRAEFNVVRMCDMETAQGCLG